ncbi:Predicted phosphoesterase [Paenibacillus sp. UNC496MF]|uniref:metallophosphoesterase family protein n=1 Tax=Paenibacillus sp. UNC496MF TaxID=1502753 RepID=UPI0008E8ED5E|nr:metallophosphoesterase [Paenibacillus sp. UNC496MF]SFJ80106.1 Predicted phosphoesterase [Paenibacillus sp. UNC496MF]
MKLFIVSDEESAYIWDHFDPERFKDIDLIISCGDLKAAYLSFLVSMLPVPLFYVHGNHDATYKTHPPEGCECIDGRLVRYRGLRILGLGGSHRYSPGDHQYTERQMRWRIAKLRPGLWRGKGVDIVVAHAPAYQLGDGEDPCHRGFQCFVDLMDRHRPRLFLHGHQHLNYGRHPRVRQYRDTRIVNAFGHSIVTL